MITDIKKLFAHITNFWVKPKQLDYTIDKHTITFGKKFDGMVETCIYIISINRCNIVIFNENLLDVKNQIYIQIPRDVVHLSFPPVLKVDLPKHLKILSVQNITWCHTSKYLEKLELVCSYSSCIMLCKNMRIFNVQSCTLKNNCDSKNITHLTITNSKVNIEILPKKLYYLCDKLNSNDYRNMSFPKHIKYAHIGAHFKHKILIPKYTKELSTGPIFDNNTLVPETLKIFNIESFTSYLPKPHMKIIDNLPNGLEKLVDFTDSSVCDYHVYNIPNKLTYVRKDNELFEKATILMNASAKI